MSLTVAVQVWDEEQGSEVAYVLPGKHRVCSHCEGHGSHLNPSIGGYCYTREEFDEAFPDAEERSEYFKRGGRYDVTCETCKGLRVVVVVDVQRLSSDQQRVWKLVQKSERENAQMDAIQRSELRAERGWEPGYC